MSTEEPKVEDQVELSEVQKAAREKKVVEMGGGAVACVECEKRSYPAETVYMELLPRHKECFKCSKCTKKIDSTINASVFDHKLLCKVCFTSGGYNRLQAQVKWTPKGSTTTASGAFAKLGGGSTPCTGCQKSAYPAEQCVYNAKIYHPHCIKCSDCEAKCTVNNINEFEDKLYCSGCFLAKGFNRLQAQVKWQPSASGSSTASSGAFAKLGGGATPCTLCTKSVYPAELVSFEGKPYHGGCIMCSECNNKCTINNINEFENKLYCTGCWSRGGFNRKQLESTKTTCASAKPVNPAFAKLGGGAQKCFECEKSVYPAETLHFEGKVYHNTCLVCADCKNRTQVANANAFHDKVYCKGCWTSGNYARKQLLEGKVSSG